MAERLASLAGIPEDVVVTLTNPQLEGEGITYDAAVLEGEPAQLLRCVLVVDPPGWSAIEPVSVIGALPDIDGAHPWWSPGIFAICLVCIYGLVVLGETRSPDQLAAGPGVLRTREPITDDPSASVRHIASARRLVLAP
jgi:hypothetical protein